MEHYEGKVKHVIERQHKIGWGGRDKRDTMVSERKFDAQGRITQERYRTRMHINRITYTYNRKGLCTERREYDAERMLFFRYRFKYDRWGNQIEEQSIAPDGTLTSLSRSTYNEQGHEVEKRLRRGESADHIKYTYDNRGNVIEEEKKTNGAFSVRRLYRYDDHNNKIEDTQFEQDGSVTTQRFEYKYDSNGLLLEEQIFNRENQPTTRYAFHYDPDGRCIQRSQYDNQGNFNSSFITYNNGQKTEERWMNSSEKQCGRIHFQYNENGEMIKESIYHGSMESAFQEVELHDNSLTHHLQYICSNEILVFQYTYTYANNGILSERLEEHFSPDGTPCHRSLQKFAPNGSLIEESQNGNMERYEYDHMGNWTKKSIFINNELVSVIEREFDYWE